MDANHSNPTHIGNAQHGILLMIKYAFTPWTS